MFLEPAWKRVFQKGISLQFLNQETLVRQSLWICALCMLSAAGISRMALGERAAPNGVVNWPGHGGSSDETAYSPLQQVNGANVGRLGLAWYLDLPGERMLEATPLAVNGVLYFTGSYATVYATDAVSGKLLWTYDPQIWKHGPQKLRYALPCNRGVAYEDGRVFVGTIDGRLIALDAKTGGPLWSTETTAPGSVQTITGAPRAFNGKSHHRQRRSGLRRAGLCHRLRCGNWTPGLALLHGAGFSGGEPG